MTYRLQLSKHAERRCNERGIRLSDLQLLIAHADVVVAAGRGAEQLFLSPDGAADLLARGVLPQIVDRIRRLSAVCADGRWLTVHHGENGRRKRLVKGAGRRRSRLLPGRGRSSHGK